MVVGQVSLRLAHKEADYHQSHSAVVCAVGGVEVLRSGRGCSGQLMSSSHCCALTAVLSLLLCVLSLLLYALTVSVHLMLLRALITAVQHGTICKHCKTACHKNHPLCAPHCAQLSCTCCLCCSCVYYNESHCKKQYHAAMPLIHYALHTAPSSDSGFRWSLCLLLVQLDYQLCSKAVPSGASPGSASGARPSLCSTDRAMTIRTKCS